MSAESKKYFYFHCEVLFFFLLLYSRRRQAIFQITQNKMFCLERPKLISSTVDFALDRIQDNF